MSRNVQNFVVELLLCSIRVQAMEIDVDFLSYMGLLDMKICIRKLRKADP